MKDIPKYYYNIAADLSYKMSPVLNPRTKKPIRAEELAPIFPNELIRQEMSKERYIEIPGEVRELYRLYRPTPLIRAKRLEQAIGTTARIYYKNESVSPTGSHKLNTALAQAYYNKEEGTKKIVTETGAGQWGSALSYACNMLGLECEVYMVRASYEQKPYRKVLMQTFGASVYPSPSDRTEAGRTVLRTSPDCSGSLGIAISEAVEAAAKDSNVKYSLGSVLNHVLLHQTVIGQEAKVQLGELGEEPDIIIGCVGGGSNFAGISFPFVKDRLDGKKFRFLAVEPKSCASLTKGKYEYDFGDAAETTPLLKMFTLGHRFIPEPIHAGGLRYHGMAPLISLLYREGIIEALSYAQNEVFSAAVLFARTEGIIPAPETAHAIKAVIDMAKDAANGGKTIVFSFSGHGYFDMKAYSDYFAGELR